MLGSEGMASELDLAGIGHNEPGVCETVIHSMINFTL